MPDNPQPELTARIYDSIAAFNATACWQVLQLAQMRQHLAEHLAADLLPMTAPVPSAPADRAAILREAADVAEALRQFEPATGARKSAQVSENVGVLRVADELRRMADEAEYVATPCDFVACEPGGEPCSTHERLMAHAEGDHELCGPDCGTSPDRVADEAQQPETQAVCEGFQWIGQSFATCDRCGQPAWDHAGEEVAVDGAGPLDTRRTVRPWKPGQADAIRAKWEQPAAVSQPGKEG